MNLSNLELLGAVADRIKRNDFIDPRGGLQGFVSTMFKNGRRLTLFVYIGKKLKISLQETTGDITTTTVGDGENQFLKIVDHGTGLKGLIEVLVTLNEHEGHLEVVIEAFPLSNPESNFAGMLWIENVQTLGYCSSRGYAMTFSADHLQFPIPNIDLGMIHCLRGISFGFVIPDENEHCFHVIGDMVGENFIITPVSADTKSVAEYKLRKAREYKQPEGMTEIQFSVIKMLFRNGISIFSEEGIRASVKSHPSDFSDDETERIVKMVWKLTRLGWFAPVAFLDRVYDGTYFVPTNKLLLSL